jgi:uronate dehydrogenase
MSASASRPTVLVTGMSGLIGSAVRKRLEDRYQLRALNRREVPGVPTHRADIGDLETIAPAFAGIDVVVHLAAAVGNPGFDDALRVNVVGTYNVFEAARRAGVRRVVSASSGAVISAWERDPPYSAIAAGRYDGLKEWPMMTGDTPLRPAGIYGCSKIWGEALARHYADAHGMSMICVRIGRVRQDDRPSAARDFSVWCSQRDIAQMIERCVAAPATVTFDVFFAVSKNRWSYRDIEHARAVLGYEPLDSADAFR